MIGGRFCVRVFLQVVIDLLQFAVLGHLLFPLAVQTIGINSRFLSDQAHVSVSRKLGDQFNSICLKILERKQN